MGRIFNPLAATLTHLAKKVKFGNYYISLKKTQFVFVLILGFCSK